MLRVLLLFIAFGTTSVIAGEPSVDKKVPGFASPREAWEAYRHARHEGRWREAFQCLTPESQDRFVGTIIHAGAYLKGSPAGKNIGTKIEAILKNHGLDLAQIEADADRIPKHKVAE